MGRGAHDSPSVRLVTGLLERANVRRENGSESAQLVGLGPRQISSTHTAVEAQTLSRSAGGGDVTGLAAHEASTTAHRERHSYCLAGKTRGARRVGGARG